MQAKPRWAAGTRASVDVSKRTSTHQHGVSKLPVLAAMQPFGRAHSGQVGAAIGSRFVSLLMPLTLSLTCASAVARNDYAAP